MKLLLTPILFFALLQIGCNQRDKLPPIAHNLGFRGLCEDADGNLYAAGQNGSVFSLSTARQTWQDISPKDYADGEFRDVVFHASTGKLLAMGITRPARLMSYSLAEKAWTTVYENQDTSVFLDGMAQHNNQVYVYGDPVDGEWFMLRSSNLTDWDTVVCPIQPVAGEAGFAASGTGLIVDESGLYLASGGKRSGVYHWKEGDTNGLFYELPYDTLPGSGVFSIAKSETKLWAVGGDYTQAESTVNTGFIIDLEAGKTIQPETNPLGYRSSIVQHRGILMCSGRNGTDISSDEGKNWTSFSTFPYYRLHSTEHGVVGIGNQGRVYLFSDDEILNYSQNLE